MKLRTSFFNPTVLKKDITRYAPVWGLYSVFLLLILMVLNRDNTTQTADNFFEFFNTASFTQLIYGGLCAALLFGDLFNPRMCNALHAFPIRREGWFLTHLTAGLLFFLVPTGVFSVLMMLLIGKYWYLALVYLAFSFLMFLFFFGVGAFSAMCAGNRLAMMALYTIINFFSLFVLCLAYAFFEPFLYGIELDSAEFFHYSPVLALSGCRFVDFRYYYDIRSVVFTGSVSEEWTYLGWTTFSGLLFLGLALLVYRRRNLETAGDFISAKPAAPFFLVIFSLSAGMLLYFLGSLFNDDLEYIFLAIGILVGFFAGKMLLDRTVKVFKPKAFLGLGILAAALLLSVGAMSLDVFGIVHYVPRQEQVRQVTVRSGWGNEAILTDPEEIQQILEFHEDRLDDTQSTNIYPRIYLDYTLTDGSTVSRNYFSSRDEQKEMFRSYFSRWQSVFGTDDWETFKSRVNDIYTDGEISIPPEAYDELLEAIKLDCEAGNMAQDYDFHDNEEIVYWMDIGYNYNPATKSQTFLSLRIYKSCENALEVLNRYAVKAEK